MNDQNSEHDDDLYLWSKNQANILRSKEFDKLDIINLIEEIEDLGKSEKRALLSHLTIKLMHMLKVKYQPEKSTRSWELSIKISDNKAKSVLNENPSLKSKLKEIIDDAYSTARLSAAQETGLDEEIFPEKCPWKLKEVIGE